MIEALAQHDVEAVIILVYIVRHGANHAPLLVGTPSLHGARSGERCIGVIVSIQVSGMRSDILHIQPRAIP